MKALFSKVAVSALLSMPVASTIFASNNYTQVPQNAELRALFKKFNITAMPQPKKDSDSMIELGRELYFETALSGNKNISCATCHHPNFGSSDALPLSIGEGGETDGSERSFGEHGLMIPRSAPAVFNLGQEDIRTMFWDGRLSKSKVGHSFQTPEAALNGNDPKAKEIVAVLDSALAAQAMFPVTAGAEMCGQKGTNEIADLDTNLEIWAALTARIMAMPKYQKMMANAFPGTTKFNFGHIGRAIGAFERFGFSATETPLQKYLLGDNSALSDKQKIGAAIFMKKGRCAACHNGPHLASNDKFFATGIPQIGMGKNEETGDDLGRARETGRESHRYAFRVMSLINISESAPYMHDGAIATLEEVVEHYNDVEKYMHDYDGSTVERQEFLGRFDEMTDLNRERMKNVPLVVKKTKRFSNHEKSALVEFLRNGLKDQSYIERAQPKN